MSYAPNFSGLVELPALSSQAGRNFLRWLDRSGLALTFLRRLQGFRATQNIPTEWHHALAQRLTRNVERTQDMLEEAHRLNGAFRSFGVIAASLKGFTLCPDFCEEPSLRHQVDFDFLVAASSVSAAAEALRSCGYSASRLNPSGETCFITPLRHIPSPNDDLYALQHHRQVDLHTSIWETCSWLRVKVPQDCLEHVQPQSTSGVELLSLALEDKFLLQVLHTFRHSFRSWIRVSWLLEIARCIENHREDVALWNRVISRAGTARLTKSIFAFVLGLVERLFRTSLPSPVRFWTEEAMTLPLRAWLNHFGFDWAISDWPGSLNNLFLTAEFVPDPSLRVQYWRSRLLPRKTHASLGAIAATNPNRFFQLQAARLSYVACRAVTHLKDIVNLPRQQFRWKRALESCRRHSFDPNC
jgi:Uncharacterised nucleotidyltransferase